MDTITVEKFQKKDRQRVRDISFKTSFLERPQDFFDDEEIAADALTMYFTDFEPESCWVVKKEGVVAGYLIGAARIKKMEWICLFLVYPLVLMKVFFRGSLLRKKNRQFIWNIYRSFTKGEFVLPSFMKQYPATFHINLEKEVRGLGLGRELISRFSSYLTSHGRTGVYAATMNEDAKNFFINAGFKILLQSQRTYLNYILKDGVTVYTLGKSFYEET